MPLVIASHNRGKARDIASLFTKKDITLLFAYDLEVPEPDETGKTFIANAALKAMHSLKQTGLPSIADDCGLEVLALRNQPGIYSKRYAKRQGSWKNAMEVILQRLKGKSKKAMMCCSLSVAFPDGTNISVLEKLEGTIVEPRGTLGFGFDPFFLPTNSRLTLGEMTEDFRNRNNHRWLAFSSLEKKVSWEQLGVVVQGYSH